LTVTFNCNFLPFQIITSQYGISNNRFLEYQQLKSVISKKFPLNQINLELPPSVTEFRSLGSPKLLSKIYRLISKIDDTISLPIAKWESDLSLNPTNQFWSEIILNNFNMTDSLNLQLVQYKILHRTYYTGQRMFKMGFNQSNTCTQCKNNTADDYMHALWLCTPVQRFLTKVCEDLSIWLNCNTYLSKAMFIMGFKLYQYGDQQSTYGPYHIICRKENYPFELEN